jgi:hypothetical protein
MEVKNKQRKLLEKERRKEQAKNLSSSSWSKSKKGRIHREPEETRERERAR